MSKRKEGTGDYEIGFGRPPKSTRFKPGQSGNPKGRPPKSSNATTILREALFRPVPVRENGTSRTVPFLEAFLMVTAKGALGGDGPAANRVIRLLPLALQALDAAEPSASSEGTITERQGPVDRVDRDVLRHFADLVRSGEINLDKEVPNDQD